MYFTTSHDTNPDDQSLSFKEWDSYLEECGTKVTKLIYNFNNLAIESTSDPRMFQCDKIADKIEESIEEQNYSQLTAPDSKISGFEFNNDLAAVFQGSYAQNQAKVIDSDPNDEIISIANDPSSYAASEAGQSHLPTTILDKTLKKQKIVKPKWNKKDDKTLYKVICEYSKDQGVDVDHFMKTIKQRSYPELHFISKKAGWGLPNPRLIKRIQAFLNSDKSRNTFTVREKKELRKMFYDDLKSKGLKIANLDFGQYDWQHLKENFPIKSLNKIKELVSTFGRKKPGTKVSKTDIESISNSTTSYINDNCSGYDHHSE